MIDILSEDENSINNLVQARDIVRAIQDLKQIQTALKAAFAHRELDGGPTAALRHPLYLQAQRTIDNLEETLTQLI